ncbi:MAG: hypothetical protein ABIX01_03545 [Chitinophagaceae bacterium]
MQPVSAAAICGLSHRLSVEERSVSLILETDPVPGSISCSRCGESADKSDENVHRVCGSYVGGVGCNGYPS